MNDAPHNHLAARVTAQWNADNARDDARDKLYGRPTFTTGRARFYIPGWAGFGGLLGAAIGAIAAHDRGMTATEGAISGGAAGFLSFLALSLALKFFFMGIGLGWAGIKTGLGAVTGFGGGFMTPGILGGLPRATARGGFIGGALGAALALWLGEPVGDAALRVASVGAAAGAGFRSLRLAMSILKRDEGPR